MSTLAVKVERIRDVQPHPNADRLEIARVLDWNCVVGKGEFSAGDLCVYFPIDSVLPSALEATIFGPDSKVSLSKGRVKTIKLRGAISQGLAVKPDTLDSFVDDLGVKKYLWSPMEGADWTGFLGVKKYEPPMKSVPSIMQGRKATNKETNPYFHKYTDIENAKNYPDVFTSSDTVVITEKIHGTNFRAGWVPAYPNTFWKKVKNFFGLLDEYEFVYGSRNIQLQDQSNKTYKDLPKNVYREIVEEYGLKDVLRNGEVIYGEIYGDGIQKGYAYGCGLKQHKLAVFDLERDGQYVDWYDLRIAALEAGLPVVPVLESHVGFDKERAKELSGGPSLLDGTISREGIVVRPTKESNHRMLGRKILKYINPDYLLRDQTDFH